MMILAFDTSTSQGGVAVVKGEQVLAHSVWIREKSHSEFLTPTIENCLNEANVRLSDIERIAVGCGPGSFTGIRIAINAARSLGYALSRKIVAFDTTEILCGGVLPSELPVVALVNAHKNLLYTSCFQFDDKSQTWTRTKSLDALSLEDIEKLIQTPHHCVGDGYLEYESYFSPGLKKNLLRTQTTSDFPLPEVLGQLAFRAQNSHPTLDWNTLQALYIRASGAEEKLREGHEKK